ncbi:hypothetical protein KUCAC02_027816, partial [Chaenocephalus aceratus]
YGSYLKLLTEDAVSDLPLLMRNIKIFLSTQRVTTAPQLMSQSIFSHQSFGSLNSASSRSAGRVSGYDWLASTVFLIMAGNMDRSLKLLLNLSLSAHFCIHLATRIHASVNPCSVEVAESGISPMYWCTAHYVEMLLRAEVPLVHSAFRMSGFTPSQGSEGVLWNYLDWAEICHYVSTCVLMGPDYQVYMCVAVFTHLQPDNPAAHTVPSSCRSSS